MKHASTGLFCIPLSFLGHENLSLLTSRQSWYVHLECPPRRHVGTHGDTSKFNCFLFGMRLGTLINSIGLLFQETNEQKPRGIVSDLDLENIHGLNVAVVMRLTKNWTWQFPPDEFECYLICPSHRTGYQGGGCPILEILHKLPEISAQSQAGMSDSDTVILYQSKINVRYKCSKR
jgi:hypothetical protein